MSDFRLGSVPSSSVLHVYSMRDGIWFDPPYQRMSDVWPLEKRQLLIDSILNGYDVPKLYFHEYYPAKTIDGKKYKFAIVDGKQRLQSIFAFIEGKFALDAKMEMIDEPETRPGGLTYAELARNFPDLKTKFDGFVLPIVSILTEDTELIEDMFSRLNEAVPLNAAEKRNAFGGVVPVAIRGLSKHPFFLSKIPFTNNRYRHFDLAAKFLFISEKGHLADTKKVHLDEFVKEHRTQEDKVKSLLQESNQTLDLMAKVFVDGDWLLRSVGTVLLYYFLFVDATKQGWVNSIERASFNRFEELRANNRRMAENEFAKADFDLLEYDRLTQSPNDSVALRFRYSLLRKHIGPVADRPPSASTT